MTKHGKGKIVRTDAQIPFQGLRCPASLASVEVDRMKKPDEGKAPDPRTVRTRERRADALRTALQTGVGLVRMYELAALLGVTRQTIHDWYKKGLLPKPIVIGGRVAGFPATVARDLLNGKKAA
jgi:predicted DNA-binding transcriptional regulator AlpA